MDEIVFKSPYPVKNRLRSSTRRAALTVINGEINTRKRNSNILQLNCKTQKQENFPINPYLPNAQKLKIIEDVNSECKLFNNENHLSTENEIVVDSDSSPECIAASPEALKDSHCLYSRQKKEKQTAELIWNTPYRKDIYLYFMEIEKKFRPNPDYMNKQTDISMSMRCVLVDWFVEVGEEYKLHPETLHLAVSYVDRFLSHMSVLRGKLQLVGTASMLLASKYEEIYPPELRDFVYITDNTYSKKQVLRMEHLILKVLNFDISAPTAYTFQQLYCSMLNASETVVHLSQYFCELSLLDGDPFLKFLPSVIAAGSIALANYTLGLDMWDEILVETTGYQLTDLMYVIMCLYNKYCRIPTSKSQSMMEKYKSTKYGCVATIQAPDTLVFPDKSRKELYYI